MAYSRFLIGCQDIDDALHAKLLPNGNIEAGVREFSFFPLIHLPTLTYILATYISKKRTDVCSTRHFVFLKCYIDIADVSHFVLPDNPMDHEAAARGTTVYLVDKRIDMLPALLGTNLCSLRPHVERLAFSVIWVCTFS